MTILSTGGFLMANSVQLYPIGLITFIGFKIFYCQTLFQIRFQLLGANYHRSFQQQQFIFWIHNNKTTKLVSEFVTTQADSSNNPKQQGTVQNQIGTVKKQGSRAVAKAVRDRQREREIQSNGSTTKLNVITLEADGHKIQCTLFGNYVDELNNFIASGEVQNAVVIIQFAKAKLFQVTG